MKVSLVSNSNVNFGLKKGPCIDIIFDAARRNASRQFEGGSDVVSQTNKLISRIQKRAPHTTLKTTGGTFYVEKAGKEYYMADIVPGIGLINSLKNLDVRLRKFDKDVKSGLVDRVIPLRQSESKMPPIMVRIVNVDPNSNLGKVLSSLKTRKK